MEQSGRSWKAREEGAGREGWVWAGLGLAALVVVPASALAAGNGFDGLYGQDAYAYYDYATGPLRERLLAFRPPPPFYWPPGYPLLVAMASLLVGPRPVAGQVVSLLAAAWVPVWTALLAQETVSTDPIGRPSKAALLAGAVVALNGQLWQSSIVVMSDTVAIASATLGALAVARYGRRQDPRWLMVAAGALAWAVLTRWAYAVVALPGIVYVAWTAVRSRRVGRLVHVGAALLIALAILWPVLRGAVETATTPTAAAAAFTGNLRTFRWHPWNAFRREFVTPDGLLRHRLPSGLYYALTPGRSFFLTPVLLALALSGGWAILRRRRPAAALLVPAWATAVYILHAGSTHQNPRFVLAQMPPLAILAAVGAQQVARAFGRRGRGLLTAALVAAVVWMAVGGTLLTESFIRRAESVEALVPWVEQQVEPDARLLTFGVTLTFEHESRLDVRGLYVMEPEGLVETVGEGRPTYLLLDLPNVESQWARRRPEEHYVWLRDGPGLTALGSRHGYTLFRVGQG